MKAIILFLLLSCSLVSISQIPNFEISIKKDSVITNKSINSKDVIFFFIDKSCPYAELYKKRIENLILTYPKIQFFCFGSMKLSQTENLIQNDDKKKVLKNTFQINKNPSSIYYSMKGNIMKRVYFGAIDDNPQLEQDVRHSYLREAIESIKKNKGVQFDNIQPMGCYY